MHMNESLMLVNVSNIHIYFHQFFCDWPVVVEGAGAAGLAAILAGQLNEFKDKKYEKTLSERFNQLI